MYLAGQLKFKRDRQSAPSVETMAGIGKRCSYLERRAESAERELKQIKLLRFLEKHIGDVEAGVVTGVTQVGVFVQLRKYLVDGLVRFDDMPDDWWEIDSRRVCVVGQRSGRRIAMGDRLDVQIAAVNIALRELNLMLAPTSSQATKRSPATKTSKRSPRQKTRKVGGGRSRTKNTGPKRSSKSPTRGRRR